MYWASLKRVMSGKEMRKPRKATILAIHLTASSCPCFLGHKTISTTPRRGKKHTIVRMFSIKKLID
jgi:hypothetical protein